MRFNLVTNLDNGAGLQKDYALLRKLLEERGHTVNGVHIHHWKETLGNADVNVFLEVLVPELLPFARQNWLIPNSEWWSGGRWNDCIPRIDRVLCKTPDCLRIWEPKCPGKCVLTGWAAEDRYSPMLTREPIFLHLAGKSLTKNTQAVIECWKRFKLPYPLKVSAFKPEIMDVCRGVPNVELIPRYTDVEVNREMNRCQFFIMPSKYEGYGHAIHEALGCGAAVITTNAEPMRGFSGLYPGLLVDVQRKDRQANAVMSFVSVSDLHRVVTTAAMLSPSALEGIGRWARAGFLKDNADFLRKMDAVIPRANTCAA